MAFYPPSEYNRYKIILLFLYIILNSCSYVTCIYYSFILNVDGIIGSGVKTHQCVSEYK